MNKDNTDVQPNWQVTYFDPQSERVETETYYDEGLMKDFVKELRDEDEVIAIQVFERFVSPWRLVEV